MANPRLEAYERLAGEYEVRVLEPSPPAVTEPPFSDDPAHCGEIPEGRIAVSPIPNADLTWDAVARDNPEIAGWCAERWLGAWRDLAPLAGSFEASRRALHAVAERLVAPARKPVAEISLRYTRGGFGTPFFEHEGADCQVRVEGAELVRQRGDDEAREQLGTLAAGAELLGPGLLGDGVPEGELDPGEELAVEAGDARALGDLYGFACSVLEEIRSEAAPVDDPSLIRIWPEHFDIAFESGVESAGVRATYGLSPGDEAHPEPYLYVGPWSEVSGELWNATGFNGAELTYAELVAADDQRAAALAFLRERVRALDEL